MESPCRNGDCLLARAEIDGLELLHFLPCITDDVVIVLVAKTGTKRGATSPPALDLAALQERARMAVRIVASPYSDEDGRPIQRIRRAILRRSDRPGVD